ncbi:MAG: hypothetical protein K0Q74_1087 [Gammaproteobacteria bacterium]|jgi:chorismate-pyruvate lyase|nr:hypothetical protein [Gammaproteobacteria bacterium]
MGSLFVENFYKKNNFHALKVNRVAPPAIPEPFLSLLSHLNYMTSTLSNYMDDRLQLERLDQIVVDRKLQRVIKLQTKTGIPVMLAFVEIYLTAMDDHLAQVVIEGKEPLGRLLLQHNIAPNLSCEGLYEVEADDFLSETVKVKKGAKLYGRNSLVKNPQNQLIADSFEVLALGPSYDHAFQPQKAGK